MSITQYWMERLRDQNPLRLRALRINRVNVRANPGMDPEASWPRAVARSAIFEDYTVWHDEVFLANYRDVPYYQTRLPNPAGELVFFNTIYPWLYVLGKSYQVRAYRVPGQLNFETAWVDGRSLRYFVRLLEWQHHVAAFELSTGLQVQDHREFHDPEKARMLAEAKEVYLLRVERHQELLIRNPISIMDDEDLTEPNEADLIDL